MDRCSCLHYGAGDPDVEVYGLGAAAMRLQQRGYAVLPLARGQKRPHAMLGDAGGVHWATLHPLYAMNWWQQDPAANVGVATGSRSQLVVIDLDVKNGNNGIESFNRFLVDCASAGQVLYLSNDAQVQTPSGGLHIWLRTPPGVVVPERPGILPGVDVKGDGGLVVAPPSMALKFPMVRAGERSRGEAVPVPYRWVAGCPCQVPPAPPWLVPWLASAPAPQSAGATQAGAGEAGLGDLASTGIPVGQRNRDLYRYACARYRLHGTGPSGAAMVLADCEHVLARTDRSDFGSSEVMRILASARQFIAAQHEAEQSAVARWRRGWAGTR